MQFFTVTIELSIAKSYGRGSIPIRSKRFFLHSVQIDSGALPASYPVGVGGSFPAVKRLGRDADHTPPASAEAKNDGAILPLPLTSSRRGAPYLNLYCKALKEVSYLVPLPGRLLQGLIQIRLLHS
jgi:hypothetical protein